VIDVDKADGLPIAAFYTVNGTPFVNVKYVRLVDGSPYFSERWMKALAIADNGKRFRSSKVKFDLIDNSLHFLTETGDEFVANEAMKLITLTDTVTNVSYELVHSSAMPVLEAAKKGWYRQLVNGKVSLFQHIMKTVHESKPYNSGVAEQRITTNQEYLVVYNGAVLKAKKLKDLPALLADGKVELESFLKTEAAKKGTTEEQMAALVNYYNSLQ
jgi:hypothetical protein